MFCQEKRISRFINIFVSVVRRPVSLKTTDIPVIRRFQSNPQLNFLPSIIDKTSTTSTCLFSVFLVLFLHTLFVWLRFCDWGFSLKVDLRIPISRIEMWIGERVTINRNWICFVIFIFFWRENVTVIMWGFRGRNLMGFVGVLAEYSLNFSNSGC